jgi:N2-acetyl-L-2,4-diaminobutanoate deacetylase
MSAHPSQSAPSRLSPTVPLDADGFRFGHLVAPWSRNESGWGSLRIPFAVARNGPGPTVLVTGGNHGDEFEGPLVIIELMQALAKTLSGLTGTIYMLPALNYPAVRAGTRLSPIDGANMNRAFRMRRDGTMTEQIAHFVESELVARADAVLDFHAGGKSMWFTPFAAMHVLPDPAHMERTKAALLSFGAPIGLVLEELDAEGMLDTAAERRGKIFISTELGGAGSTSIETVAFARRGLSNVLRHVGALTGKPKAGPAPTRLMTNDASGFMASDRSGLIEYLVEPGATVRVKQPIARVFDIDRPLEPPHIFAAPADGLLLGRLHGGLVAPGDFVGLVARDL